MFPKGVICGERTYQSFAEKSTPAQFKRNERYVVLS
jgi:hypothetical protein